MVFEYSYFISDFNFLICFLLCFFLLLLLFVVNLSQFDCGHTANQIRFGLDSELDFLVAFAVSVVFAFSTLHGHHYLRRRRRHRRRPKAQENHRLRLLLAPIVAIHLRRYETLAQLTKHQRKNSSTSQSLV